MKSIVSLVCAATFSLLVALSLGGRRAQSSEGRQLWFSADDMSDYVTGDIELSKSELIMQNRVYPFEFIRDVTPQESWSVYTYFRDASEEKPPTERPMMGRLYATRIPGNTLMLGQNAYCGDKDVHWALVVESTYLPKKMYMFPFYVVSPPDLTDGAKFDQEACGAYNYHRAP